MSGLIFFEGVDFKYDETPILRQISFSIQPGEFVHIIGPNGGGKTTLLKLLMGFLKPSCGEIKIAGKSIQKNLGLVAYVPQVFPFDKLFPISVLEVVLSGRLSKKSFWGRYSQKDRDIALNCLKDVGMQDFKNHAIGELSGGQVQRVLIARALASDPEILLLDEPTSCIDHSTQLEIDQILKKLKGKLTILMVTHDLDHIGKESDRVFCIHGTLSELKPCEVCQHFSMGLYQKPLEKEEVFA